MVIYFTKEELMYIWIEKSFKKLLSIAIPEVIKEKIPELPKETQIDIEKNLENFKKNPSDFFEEKTDKSKTIDYESSEFKGFEKIYTAMKKTWTEHENKFIEELKADYLKQDITIYIKE